MPQVEILNKDNKPVGKADLPDSIFGVEVRMGLLHEVVRNHMANQRQGNACTKTKGEVSGGGRKPYKQKGTGRARAGSTRSPLWKGGGTVFGPQPRDYSYKLPKKVRWLALSTALTAKLNDGEVIVVDDLTIAEPKTKLVKGLLETLGITNNVLMIVREKNEALEMGARNIPKVNVARVSELNAASVLKYEKLIITTDAIKRMEEAYLG